MLRLKERGWTLVEAMIVVAIIMILSAIAIPNFMMARSKSRLNKAKYDKEVCDTMTLYEWQGATLKTDGDFVRDEKGSILYSKDSPEKKWYEKHYGNSTEKKPDTKNRETTKKRKTFEE